MERDRLATAVVAGLLLLLLVVGMGNLLALRFEGGDVYPPYSTLRADPLGSKALFDALREVDGVSAVRHLQGLGRIAADPDSAVFLLGAPPFFDDDLTEAVDDLARAGARVVIALRPPRSGRGERTAAKGPETGEPSPETDDEPRRQEVPRKDPPGPAKDKAEGWTVRARRSGDGPDAWPRTARRQPEDLDLPETLPFYTDISFTDGDGWRTVYGTAHGPLVLERRGPSGSVVLLADTYLLSNEALRKELRPRLISWLVEDKSVVVFVEAHLGVRENPGVMSLIRKYRLTGLLYGVLLVFTLYGWNRYVPLVARSPEPGAAERLRATGRDQFAGFVNLLRRGIPRGRLMAACRDEWLRSPPAAVVGKRPRLAGIIKQHLTEADRGTDPVGLYNRIAADIAERTRK